ncbi:hypothetical protein I3760_07G136700 [Carya illinoinensis]|nr:hypothetical protein I3760_07G136700 [Carya illinoinensis]
MDFISKVEVCDKFSIFFRDNPSRLHPSQRFLPLFEYAKYKSEIFLFLTPRGRLRNLCCFDAAESNHLRFTSEHGVPHSADSRGNTDNERKEQLLYIQKPLNLHEEYDKRDNIQMFCHLSSVELSRYAIDLEKISIQLSIEEVKEIRRMNALNIFGKSSPASHPSPTFQQVQTKR